MTDGREEALDDMHKATLELIKLIEIERKTPSGGTSWHDVELVLLNIRDAWEGAKACEIMEVIGDDAIALN